MSQAIGLTGFLTRSKESIPKFPCVYCGINVRKPTFEHVVPASLGGTRSWINRLDVHSRCNLERGSIPFLHWMAALEQTDYSPVKARKLFNARRKTGSYRLTFDKCQPKPNTSKVHKGPHIFSLVSVNGEHRCLYVKCQVTKGDVQQ